MSAVSISDPDQLAITTIRTLCMDAVQQANSGHPGTPEQASTFGWERYVGANGSIVGMDTFGASAPLKHLQTKFGFTPEAAVGFAKERVGRSRAG